MIIKINTKKTVLFKQTLSITGIVYHKQLSLSVFAIAYCNNSLCSQENSTFDKLLSQTKIILAVLCYGRIQVYKEQLILLDSFLNNK